MKTVFTRFLRSPLGLGIWVLCILFASLSMLMGAVPALVAIPVFALAGILASLFFMLTPMGARSVVGESDRERGERDARVLGGVAAARKRLSLLRIADPRVRESLDRLVFAAGSYLESAVRHDSRDPVAEDAVLGAVEAVDDYLRLSDAASSSRRRGKAVAGNAASKIDKEPDAHADRTVRALDAASSELELRLGAELGGFVDGGPNTDGSGITAADRVKARGELE